ncbi:MFS transporter [Microbulbifer sp. YPW1]|uniref:MFS transporter n=1 Tax=Microbulbifer sp. YPW1 TaxID=2745199 RepID=UPI00159A785C|nr:MFS transporter [Microbulbifer sp. YPW1]QKX17194.1 MFS transporter [Microbulbifer sp. YPW1]
MSAAEMGQGEASIELEQRPAAARLSVRVKLFQALGALPDTFKTFAFNTFLLLFYSQVLNLPASLASAALMISVVLDAITDPLVGSFSDRLRTPLGRRHPLMYAAVLPLGGTLILLFSPPADLSQWALFGWLLFFSSASRVAMTFFLVPWSALFAELSDDYYERSSIITYRYVVGALGGVAFVWCCWSFIFPASELYEKGQLNPDAYSSFALVLALAVSLTALIATQLTVSQIPRLRQSTATRPFSFLVALQDIRLAMQNRDFLVLFVGLLLASVLTGIIAAFEIYFHTYFWGFSAEDLRWLAIGGIGALIGAALVGPMQKWLDKKDLLLGSMIFSLADGLTIISLRLLDILPANGDPLLLQILVANEVFRMASLSVTIIMFVSMVADTLDAQELETGLRQEGVFSSAIAFSSKAVSGVGVLVVGLLLEHVVMLPTGAVPDAVAPDVVFRLGVFGGLLIPALYLIPFYLATKYRITRKRHAEIQAALRARSPISS